MKYIIAIIQPDKLEEVQESLYSAGINLITVSEVMGHGRQKGVAQIYRGIKESGNLLRKIKIEIAVNDSFADIAVQSITKSAKTGETGDGKIFVLDLEQCTRIRTSETGNNAIG